MTCLKVTEVSSVCRQVSLELSHMTYLKVTELTEVEDE
jgi:hypothetical protein